MPQLVNIQPHGGRKNNLKSDHLTLTLYKDVLGEKIDQHECLTLKEEACVHLIFLFPLII